MFATLHFDGSGARVQRDQDHSEVGSAQVEGEIAPLLLARGERVDVRGEALDVGGGIRLLAQAAVDFIQHPFFNVQQMSVRQMKSGSQLFQGLRKKLLHQKV